MVLSFGQLGALHNKLYDERRRARGEYEKKLCYRRLLTRFQRFPEVSIPSKVGNDRLRVASHVQTLLKINVPLSHYLHVLSGR